MKDKTENERTYSRVLRTEEDGIMIQLVLMINDIMLVSRLFIVQYFNLENQNEILECHGFKYALTKQLQEKSRLFRYSQVDCYNDTNINILTIV